MIRAFQAIGTLLAIFGTMNCTAWFIWNPVKTPLSGLVMVCAGFLIYIIAEMERQD
jgi:hypothetical protein